MKKIFSLLLVVFTAALLTVSVCAIDVVIDGEAVQFTESSGEPFISAESRTLVPLRVTMEAFGATVSWDAETYTALVTKGEVTVACKIGENCIYRNGTRIPNDTAAVIENGRTYLPIRAVLEAFNAKVGWDGRVLVTRPGAGTLISEIEDSGITVSHPQGIWGAYNDAMKLYKEGKWAECIEQMKALGYSYIYKYTPDVSSNDALFYRELGYCYSQLGMMDEAAACYNREAEWWAMYRDSGFAANPDNIHQSYLEALRRASYANATVQMFLTTDDTSYNVRKLFGENYEISNGILTGVTLKGSEASYMNEFTEISGKEAGGFIIYSTIEQTMKLTETWYMQALKAAKEQDKVIQLALEFDTDNGISDYDELLSITENDPRYIQIAKELNATGNKIFVRFACEMNDTSSPYYTTNYDAYKKAFQYVADIIHEYAPNCVMVWSPNFYPADNMEYYYPGDKYVDYVGISAYYAYNPDTDPSGLGIDRGRYEAVLDTIVSLYGHKKPIIISEGAVSYFHVPTGKYITDIASRQLYNFLTYLPIKYPQVSAMYLFETDDAGGRQFHLNKNDTYREAYTDAISSERYVSSLEVNDSLPCSFELGNNVRVPGDVVTLNAYFKTYENDFSYATYAINGTVIGTTWAIPYTLEVDLSEYKGQTVELTAAAYDSEGMLCATKTYKLVVE